MKKPRVLMLTTSYARFKGDDSLHHSWGKIVARKGFPLIVVCPSDSSSRSVLREEMDSVKVNRFQYFWPKSWQRLAYGGGGIPANLRRSPLAIFQVPLFAVSFLLSALREARNADVIDAQFIESGLVGLALKALFRKPLVVTVHRIVSSNFFERFLNRLVLSSSDVVAFNSSYTMREAGKLMKKGDWRIMNPSLDTSMFAPRRPSGFLRRKFGIPEGAKVVLSISKLVEKKGISVLIRAIPRVKDKSVVLAIGGWGVEEGRLKALARSLGLLGKRVFFVGRIENRDFPLWAAECMAFVVPSVVDSRGEIETFGLAAAEASACGRPVIASRLGGLVDVVEDGKTGFLFSPGNEAELAARISLLCSDKGLGERLGKASRKRALERFSAESEAEKYCRAYYSLGARQ